MTWQGAFTILVGLMLVAGLASVIYTMPKVPVYRKPLYWLALLMNIGLLVAFTLGALRQFTGSEIVSGSTVLVILELSLFLVALELILVPYVDRLEAKLLRGEKS